MSGLLEAQGPALFNGGAFVLMPLTTAQRLFGLKGQVNSVQLVLADGVDTGRVEALVRDRQPVEKPCLRSRAVTEAGINAHEPKSSPQNPPTGDASCRTIPVLLPAVTH